VIGDYLRQMAPQVPARPADDEPLIEGEGHDDNDKGLVVEMQKLAEEAQELAGA
jgi:hypothetical protein